MKRQARVGRARRRGFTLIELLVVTAIVALLTSILLPAMKGARDQAKQLLCLTHLRSIGQAASFYADTYKDWVIANESQEGAMPRPGVPRGYRRDDSYAHTQFAISLLNGLLYDHPVHGLYNDRDQLAMLEACRDIPQFQCPTHPVPKQHLDYIVNALVQPYTQYNVDRDRSGERWRENAGFRGQPVYDIAFFHRISTFRINPAALIYITEGHASLPSGLPRDGGTLLYHDIFYASQLPFSSFPRIANDQRHPGGINSVFFDGHAETMRHRRMDAGWPNKLGIRLKWFTTAPPSEW